jgi:hypothetical protein
MSDFIDRLVARSLGVATPVQPRLPALFEPTASQPAIVNRSVFEDHEAREEGRRAAVPAESSRSTAKLIGASAMPQTAIHHQSAAGTDFEREERRVPLPVAHRAPVQVAHPESNQLAAVNEAIRRMPWPVADDRSMGPRPPARNRAPVVVVQGRVVASDLPLPPLRHMPDRAPESANSTVAVVRDERSVRSADDRPIAARPRDVAVTPAQVARAAQVAAEPGSVDSQPRTISITIGRVEVRALMPPPLRPRPSPERRPHLSLDDYLKRRSGSTP